MADDVKVRLSAEGVQDIIAAFNQIRDTAKSAGKEGAEGFTGAFTSGLKELQANLVGFLGIGEIISSIHELFTEVTQGAVSLDKLHQTTGLSTDALQALNASAKENLISQEALDKGLQFMSRTLGQAELGSSKAQKALGDLGISMKDLQGLNADQKFLLIAQHLAAIPDPAMRAAEGAAIFGRSFAQIEPAILEVAEKGFGPFLDKLKSLGVYLSDDMVAGMKAVQQNMNEIGEEAKGMATQFLVGLVPSLQAAMNELLKDTNTAGSGFATLGEIVGRVMNGILIQFIAVGKGLGALGETIGTIWDSDKFSDWKTLPGKLADVWKNFGSDMAATSWKLFSPVAPAATPVKPPPGPDGNDGQDSDAVNKARLALTQARLQAELALYNAQSKLKMDAEKQSYDEGLISLDKYYADRQTIIQQQYAKEIQILQQRRAAIAAESFKKGDEAGPLRQQTELTTLDGQIAAKRVEQHAAVMANITEEGQARQKLQDSELTATEKLLTLEGRKADVQRLQIGLDAQKLAQSLQRGGVPQGQVGAAVGGFVQSGLNQIDFTETRTDADTAFTDLQTKIASIKAQVANGQLFPIQGEQQMQQAILRMLPSLQDYATQMQTLANATKTDQNPLGNPQLIAQADQFQQKILQLKTSTDTYGQALADLKKTAQDSLTNGLAGAIDGILSGTESLSEGFKKMALEFATAILKMESQALAASAIKALLSSFGGGGIVTAGGGEASSAVAYAADGGHLVGPSHSSGGIHIEAEGGEFIVNKQAVARPGVRSALESINGMRMPAVTPIYAAGGAVGMPMYASGGAVSGGGIHNHLKVVNLLDRDDLLDHIASSPKFGKTITNTVIANGNIVRQGISDS